MTILLNPYEAEAQRLFAEIREVLNRNPEQLMLLRFQDVLRGLRNGYCDDTVSEKEYQERLWNAAWTYDAKWGLSKAAGSKDSPWADSRAFHDWLHQQVLVSYWSGECDDRGAEQAPGQAQPIPEFNTAGIQTRIDVRFTPNSGSEFTNILSSALVTRGSIGQTNEYTGSADYTSNNKKVTGQLTIRFADATLTRISEIDGSWTVEEDGCLDTLVLSGKDIVRVGYHPDLSDTPASYSLKGSAACKSLHLEGKRDCGYYTYAISGPVCRPGDETGFVTIVVSKQQP